ncbi:MAG: metallophosphoesterase [Myxococcaceae bacterium]|nr:metallophosphoesterase [Myxococcaceae bacterium]
MASSIVVSLVTTATLALTLPVAARALLPRWSEAPRNARTIRFATLATVLAAVGVEVYGRTLAPFGGGPLRPFIGLVRASVLLLVATLLLVVAAEVVGRLYELAVRLHALAHRLPLVSVAPLIESRRLLLTQAAAASALAVGAPAFLRGGLARTDIEVETVELSVPNLPPELEGLTLVQLTDLHLGVFTGPREIGAVLERVERLRGDLVVLTGDTLDHNPRHIGEAMRALGRIRARGGVHAILGNHDHYTGPGLVAAGLRAVGIRTHVNGSTALGPDGARGRGLILAGVDDLMAPRIGTGVGPDLAAALRGRDPDDPVVLLAHNPMVFDDVAHRVAVQLSGHTHGGQINTFGVAGALLPYVAGRYTVGAATLFVSRGIGTTGPPVRLGARPEIVRIALTGRAPRAT